MILSNFSIFSAGWVFLICDINFIFDFIILLCFGLFFNKEIKSLNLTKLVIDLSLPIMLVSMYFLIFLMNIDIYFFFNFKIDNYFIFFKFSLFVFLLFCLYLSRFYFLLEKVNIFEYTVLILLSIQGTSLVLMSMNLFGIYIALEVQNLCFYVLASIKRYSNFSTEAGLKYFLLGSFSSSLLLFGISLIYGFLGTVDLFDIFFILTNFNFDILHVLLLLAIFFIICGLLFKIGSVPFHWWVPDVYEGSPTVITMIFSILPKILLIFLFIKLYFYVFFFELNFSYIFVIAGFLSIIIGGIYAMYQFKIKRFLAYSTIVNVGFILIGFCIFSLDAIYSIIVYLFCYLVPVLSFFLFLIFFRIKNKIELNNLFELSQFNYNIILVFFLSIIFFSFLGLPPFMGFFGKFFIYLNLLNNFNYLIFLILLFLSVIVGFYYIRVIRFLFFSYYQIEKKNIFFLDVNIFFTILVYINVFFLFMFDFFSENIVNLVLYSFINIV